MTATAALRAPRTRWDSAVKWAVSRSFNFRDRAPSTSALAWVRRPGSLATANTQALPRRAMEKVERPDGSIIIGDGLGGRTGEVMSLSVLAHDGSVAIGRRTWVVDRPAGALYVRVSANRKAGLRPRNGPPPPAPLLSVDARGRGKTRYRRWAMRCVWRPWRPRRQ